MNPILKLAAPTGVTDLRVTLAETDYAELQWRNARGASEYLLYLYCARTIFEEFVVSVGFSGTWCICKLVEQTRPRPGGCGHREQSVEGSQS